MAIDVKEMTDPEYGQPEPRVVKITGEQEIATDLVVVQNRKIKIGMGQRNEEKVLKFAADQALSGASKKIKRIKKKRMSKGLRY